MVTCLQLASEQLARRSHYDFGMRAAVAVLNTAKHLFLEQLKPSTENAPSPAKTGCFQNEESPTRLEAKTLCKALRLTNIPKLHPTDKLIFEEILKDVFDEGDLAAAESEESLRLFLREAAEQLLLEPSEELLAKSLQVRWYLKRPHLNLMFPTWPLARLAFASPFASPLLVHSSTSIGRKEQNTALLKPRRLI